MTNPLARLFARLRDPDGRYLLSVGLTREERDAQEAPTYGGKGTRRWLTDEEYAAFCALAVSPSDETPATENLGPSEAPGGVGVTDLAARPPSYNPFHVMEEHLEAAVESRRASESNAGAGE